jgi:hypothetical protein
METHSDEISLDSAMKKPLRKALSFRYSAGNYTGMRGIARTKREKAGSAGPLQI